MQTIPSTLLDKLKQAMQTIGNNADPKMDIIAQKANKYLTQGNFLQPRTIRTGTSLGPLDICIRREDKNLEPTEIIMAYIENGVAKVATLPYVHMPDQQFEYQYTIGPATDVACDFDGRWHRITNHTGIYFDTSVIWSLVTFGEPYLATIFGGTLYIQQGNYPISKISLATDASKVSLLRGWKSTTDVLTDQGIIGAYVKTDGKVYYRNYCEQIDGSYIWETEKEITELGSPITNLGNFRTNDYRVGFLVESNSCISLLISDRSWSGMAIEPENIDVGLIELEINVIPINHCTTKNDENISTGISELYIGCAIPITPSILSITNDVKNSTHMTIKFSGEICESLENRQAAFTLKDSLGTIFAITGTTAGADQTETIISTANYGSAKNPMTLTYSNGIAGDNLVPLLTVLKGNVHFAIPSGDTSFTADIKPPEGYETENIAVGLANLSIIATKVYYKSMHDSENIGAGLTELSIVVTKIGSNPL